ncbi:two-component sensor histidine kinase [Neobacillus notoginsengisoli]|uniref:histidine kinase n=1 Tax=Neobacillus notoginsengisoli TaxID=1578198 RepID=A0A417YVS2_9BACI|nr:ATP-binding protein [Neobacillus notoginsengisoli]RHW41499.1 two-component sensor histidine kinase [Neobacillus notoginsengisoli]
MIEEKLLLQVLIILAPVLLYSLLPENKRWQENGLIFGLLLSGAAFLSIVFSYQFEGFYWDLRYVPFVLAILYGGPGAGLIVFLVILATRTIMGGEAVVYSYFTSLATVAFTLLWYGKFWTYSSSKRIRLAILVSGWSIFFSFMMFVVFRSMADKPLDRDLFLSPGIWMFGVISIIGIGFAARLIEEILERDKMRNDIIRAEKLNTMGELAASFAHEVRNPLTVVKGFMQLMHQQETGKNHEYLTLALSEVGRAEMILSDYLNFAKPQFNKIEECSFHEVLTEIVALLGPLAAKGGVSLKTQMEKEKMCISTDRNQLKQALVNLVKNAIEATDEGGVVTISLRHHDIHAVIEIQDNGRGMSEEQLSRIGTLFYTTKEKGTGLGTCVSLRILNEMKGSIHYSSEAGKGTIVTVQLPQFKTSCCKQTQAILNIAK